MTAAMPVGRANKLIEIAGTVKYATALGQKAASDGTPFSVLVNTCVTDDGHQVGFEMTGERAEVFHVLATAGAAVKLRGGIDAEAGTEMLRVEAFDVEGHGQHVYSRSQTDQELQAQPVDLSVLYDTDAAGVVSASRSSAAQQQHLVAGGEPSQRGSGEPASPSPVPAGQPGPKRPDTVGGPNPGTGPAADHTERPPLRPRERPVHVRRIVNGVLTI